MFERTGNVYKLPMWIPIPTEKVRKASATAKTENGSSRRQRGEDVKEAAAAPSQAGWERRDRKGRIRPADEAQPMLLDVVMKESEYRQLTERARTVERPGCTRLGH